MADELKKLNGNQGDFAAHFYDEINNVIGGTNPNEKLCLLLPGIALTKSDFEYDYKNNKPKGPVVEANESRLANKLYDPFDMVGGDNGKTLDRQYRTAINMLTPKLNPVMAQAKNQLRTLLLKPFPYKFGPKNIKRAQILVDGKWTDAPEKPDENPPDENTTYTFQEVFFRLYNNYVEQLGEWADERQRHKEYYQNLAKEDKSITEEALKNRKAENDYLQWYEDNGEKWLTAINQKMSVLLSVFSDNDMKIIEGILDSGSGAELQEARQTLNNTRKINPDGGYIYPVKFNPTNWFEYLDTSFTPVDLLNSPTAILDELKISYTRRDYLNSRIAEVAAQIPDKTAAINNLSKDVDKAKSEFIRCDDALQDAMESSFGDFAKFLTVAICSACCPPAGAAVAATTAVATATKAKVSDVLKTSADNKKAENDAKFGGIISTLTSVFSGNSTVTDLINNVSSAAAALTGGKSTEIINKLDSSVGNLLKGIDITGVINTLKNNLSKTNEDSTKAEIEGKLTEAEEAKEAVGELTQVKDEMKNTVTSTQAEELLNAAPNEALTTAANSLGITIQDDITKGIDVVYEGSNKVNKAQSDYLISIDNYTTALLNFTKNNAQLQSYNLQLSTLNTEKATIDSKIKSLEAKLSRVDDFDACLSESVNPPSVPEGFTQFNIVHTTTETESSTYEHSSVTVDSKTKGFWIFKSKKRSVRTSSYVENMCNSAGTEIQIGMNVAKVGIERSWFNPGIFSLTGEMYNVANKTEKAIAEEQAILNKTAPGETVDDVLRISHGADLDNSDHMLKLSHDIFPCYPTAMVIARDVTIKLTNTSSQDKSTMYSATSEMSKSKAFFVYNAGDGSKSSTSSGKSKSSSDSRAITVRFDTPQVIGFYLQIVPNDESTKYPVELEVEDSTITKFIEKYQSVIEKRNELLTNNDVAIDETAE